MFEVNVTAKFPARKVFRYTGIDVTCISIISYNSKLLSKGLKTKLLRMFKSLQKARWFNIILFCYILYIN